MTENGPALLAAAAGVAFGHAVLPDHWVPLAVLGRTRRYPLSRVARLSGLAGVAHVLVSIVLGAVIIVVGLQFRSAIQSAQDTIVGCVLIATGLAFVVLELTGRGHHHDHDHDHDHHHDHDHGDGDVGAEVGAGPEHQVAAPASPGELKVRGSGFRGLAAVMVPFGAAASPDLTILPVFLAAATVGVATAVGALAIFAAVTIGTIVGLTLAAARGGYEVRGQWLERWGNLFTALVLVVIGVLVLVGLI
jgi:putative Mn2+ efflux pump MntP